MRLRHVLLLVALAMGLHAQAPPPAPTPAEKELQAPLVLDDGKPTQAAQTSEPSMGRALFSLVLVVGLAGGGLYLLRRYGMKRLPGSGGARLKVEETLALGDRRFVSILRADDESFLIATGPQGVTFLSRLHGQEAATFTVPEDPTLARPMPVKELEKLIGSAP